MLTGLSTVLDASRLATSRVVAAAEQQRGPYAGQQPGEAFLIIAGWPHVRQATPCTTVLNDGASATAGVAEVVSDVEPEPGPRGRRAVVDGEAEQPGDHLDGAAATGDGQQHAARAVSCERRQACTPLRHR